MSSPLRGGTRPVRPPRARFVVLLSVLLLLLVEIWLLGLAAALVGWPALLLLLMIQAVAGLVVMRRAGGSAIRSLLSGAGDPAHLGAHAVLFTGGLLLAMPGLLTDVLSLPFLVPVTRRGIARWASRRMFGRFTVAEGSAGSGYPGPGYPGPGRGDVIQGEVIRDGRDEPDDPTGSGGLPIR